MALVDIPIVIGRGDKYVIVAEYRDSDGVLVPLPSWAADVVFSDSLDPVTATTDIDDPGIVTFTILSAVTEALPEGARLRFRILDPTGEPTTLIKGTVTYD